MEFWSTYGAAVLALVGTLIGATVGAITTWNTTRITLRQSRKSSLLDLRRQEYFVAISIVYRMERALVDMAGSLSGREQPGLSSFLAKRREANESDRAAADALMTLFDANRELAEEVYRLGAIGSKEVRDRIQGISLTVSEYIDTSFDDGKFIAQHFNDMMEEFSVQTEDFISAIRLDLEIESSI